MECDKYKQVKEAMMQLQEAAIQEKSNPVIPGESLAFRSALKRLHSLGENADSFSKAALGEIGRTVALIETMNLPLDPASTAGKAHKAQLKENLPLWLGERRGAFDVISETDCGIS